MLLLGNILFLLSTQELYTQYLMKKKYLVMIR